MCRSAGTWGIKCKENILTLNAKRIFSCWVHLILSPCQEIVVVFIQSYFYKETNSFDNKMIKINGIRTTSYDVGCFLI